MANTILTQTGQQVQADLDLLDNNSATQGQVLTADGQGGCAWANAGGGGSGSLCTFVIRGKYTVYGAQASNIYIKFNGVASPSNYDIFIFPTSDHIETRIKSSTDSNFSVVSEYQLFTLPANTVNQFTINNVSSFSVYYTNLAGGSIKRIYQGTMGTTTITSGVEYQIPSDVLIDGIDLQLVIPD